MICSKKNLDSEEEEKFDGKRELTFSEQPLSGLVTVSMVSEHLLKSGHWW
jgi:hypothetical protein